MPVKYICDKCGKEVTGVPVRVIDEGQMKLYCPDNCFGNARVELATRSIAVGTVESQEPTQTE